MSNYIKGLDQFIAESNGFKKLVKGVKGIAGHIIDALTDSPIGRLLKLKKEGRLPKGVKIYLPQGNSNETKLGSETKLPEDPSQKIEIDPELDAQLENMNKSMFASLMENNGRSIELSHPDLNVINVDNKKLMWYLEKQIEYKNEAPLMIWGAPGLGKTSIVNAVTKRFGLPLIDLSMSQMLPEDFFLQEVSDGRAKSVATEWLPVYKVGTPNGDKVANTYVDDNGEDKGDIGGVIFLDEMPRASKVVQNIWLKLIFDRRMNNWVLGSKWIIMLAGNREEDDVEGVYNFVKALGNRVQHINFVQTADQWGDWAMTAQDDKTGEFIVDPAFVGFLKAHPDYFYQMDPESNSNVFPSPRSWTASSVAMINAIKKANAEGRKATEDEVENTVALSVGVPAAKAFMEFAALVAEFPIDQIEKVYTDGANAPLPPQDTMSTGMSKYVLDKTYALLTAVTMTKRGKTLNKSELDNFMTYAERLDDPTWANKLVAGLAEIFPQLKDPSTDLGKEMLVMARRFMLKYPGYRPGNKLSEDDLKKPRTN